MPATSAVVSGALLERLKARVYEVTHGRIRNLAVEEIGGQVVVRGSVTSYHTKQLALHGALELLSDERFCADISVE
jgi:hypothetical protein